MRKQINWVFFTQSPGSFAKGKDGANSFLKAADYSSSSDEVSSSDEDDMNHTRLAWFYFFIIITIFFLFITHF